MPATTKVYVGNLPDNCQDDTIRDLFTPYGGLAELAVIKNFAFVHFKDEEVAKNAVRDLNGAKLLGKEISVEISKGRGDNNKDRGDNNRRDNRKRDYPPKRDMGIRDRVPGNFQNIRNQDFAQTLSNLSGILGGGPANPILPAGLPPAGLGNLGILSAVNTLAAVAEKQKEMVQQNSFAPSSNPLPNRQPERREPEVTNRQHTRNVPDAKPPSNTNGYVIYERYYIDPNHALLKGLPLPQLPRAQGSFVGYPDNNPAPSGRENSFASRDNARSDLYAAPPSDNYNRGRSPQRRDVDNWNPANY